MTGEHERVRQLAEPLAADAGVALVEVAIKGSGPRRLVRVIVDRKGGVDLETCKIVSRGLSAVLDDEDPVSGRYSLEVTSPGTDHPLEGREAFDRVEGRDVVVHQQAGDGQVHQIRGRVTAADDDAVELDIDGDAVRIPYSEIVKSKQALPW